MPLTGDMIISASAGCGSAGTQRAFNPFIRAKIAELSFGLGDAADVDRAATLAAARQVVRQSQAFVTELRLQ